jgi:hypothetical protein
MEIIIAIGLGVLLLLPRRSRSFSEGILLGIGWSALAWISGAWAVFIAQSLPALGILLIASCIGVFNVR